MAAAERPRYGGTLLVKTGAAPEAPDPAAHEKVATLVFEGLTRLDRRGRPQPALAVSWRHDPSKKRWQFQLRADVKLHDESLLTPAKAAAALGAAAEGRAFRASGGGLVVQSAEAMPELAGELAAARYRVVVRAADGTTLGTGPFRIAEWEPSRRALLAAHESYWGGRPYLDGVEIEMGRPAREQWIDFELGRADIVEIPPGEMRRAEQRNWRIWSSSPVELLVLVFRRDRAAVQEVRLREAIGLAIDRAAILTVLLQKQGEPSGSLLPQWLSGYSFLFPAARDLARARLPASSRQVSLAHDASDALGRAVAERIALNAREAGITVRVSGEAGAADVVLTRARVESSSSAQALMRLAESLGLAESPDFGGPMDPEKLYAAERALLEAEWVIPLFHLPVSYALSRRVKNWPAPARFQMDRWPLEDVWLVGTGGRSRQ